MAAVIGGGIAAAGAIGGSLIQSSAASNSAAEQAASANQADQTQLSMYNQTQANQTPWLNSGSAALNQLDYLMGITPQAGGTANSSTSTSTPSTGSTNGVSNINFTGGVGTNSYNPMQGVTTADGAAGSLAQPFNMSDFTADPGYNFSLQQGQQSLDQSAAAQGGMYSGAAAEALQTYGQNTAYGEYQQVYNNYQQNQSNLFNRLSGIAGTGQTSANQLGTTGTYTANAISGNQTSAGAAAAAGTMGAANAQASGLSNLGGTANSLAQYYAYNGATGLGAGSSGTVVGTGGGQQVGSDYAY